MIEVTNPMELNLPEMKAFVRDVFSSRCSEDDPFYDWLENSGFYIAPAARSNHSNFVGGLFYHSYNVAFQLERLTEKLGLQWNDNASPRIIGMLHDICKLDDYSYDGYNYYKNQAVQHLSIGSLFQNIEYKPTFPGHGSKSLSMISGRINLTDEERFCIMFHMGSFTDKSEWSFYTNGIHMYPNVLYTHMADMIAAHIMEVQ